MTEGIGEVGRRAEELMPALEALVCIVCVAMARPGSNEGEGWLLVPHRTEDGDEHDDPQWVCPKCKTGSDEFAARKLALEQLAGDAPPW